MRRLWTAAPRWARPLALAGLCAMAACSSPPAATHPAGPSSRAGTPATLSATGSRHRPGPAPGRRAEPGGRRRRSRPRPAAPRVTVTRMRTADGSVVTVATFAGPVTYVLHDGSEDPGAAAGRVKAGPVVAGAERKRLLAAFNGGFKLSAGVGGYEQEGHVASALRRGLASLVIDRSGQARIGVWGHGVPAPGEAVYSVRQNLPPLVLNGKPTAAAADWACGAPPSAAASTSPAARSARTPPATSSTPRACPPPRPTWRSCWPTPAPGPRWSSTSTPSGSSWTWPATRAARCGPRFPASTVRPTSTSPGGPGTSSPSWARPGPAAGAARLQAPAALTATRDGALLPARRAP